MHSETNTSYWFLHTAEDVPLECDDFQIAVLMNQFECQKHKNYRESIGKCHLKYAMPNFLEVTSHRWPT